MKKVFNSLVKLEAKISGGSPPKMFLEGEKSFWKIEDSDKEYELLWKKITLAKHIKDYKNQKEATRLRKILMNIRLERLLNVEVPYLLEDI